MKIQVPGKTFIFGEYGVLRKGPALVFLNEPSFELRIPENVGPSVETVSELQGLFHEESPAGKLIHHYLFHSAAAQFVGHTEAPTHVMSSESTTYERDSSLAFEFFDPYIGRGGLGGSTAEYLALYEWLYPTHTVFQMWDNYRIHANQGGQIPSGVDIVAQSQGGLCLVDESRSNIQHSSWRFEDCGLAVFRTGQKLKTHEHLSNLKAIDFEAIVERAKTASDALTSGSSAEFAQAITQFYSELVAQGLQSPHTQDLVKKLNAQEGVLASKGCGAMGVDFILCMYRKSSERSVVDFAVGLELELAATLEQISPHRVSSPFYI